MTERYNMISVNKNSVNLPNVLDLNDPASKASKELEKATNHFAGNGAKPKFAVYKDKNVKNKLDRLFNGKCAYCESQYAATQPMDVEHYRPKNAVKGEGDHDGYWWLAMNWENLLPSCIDCNRERTQTFVLSDGSSKVMTLGKGSKFPIADIDNRAYSPNDSLDDEEALLINPCTMQVQDHLKWKFDSGFCLAEHRDPAGKNSIEVYGLNRMGLVRRRTIVLRRLEALKRTIIGLARALELVSEPKVANIIETIIGECISDLEDHTNPEREFTGMAREFVDQFKSDF